MSSWALVAALAAALAVVLVPVRPSAAAPLELACPEGAVVSSVTMPVRFKALPDVVQGACVSRFEVVNGFLVVSARIVDGRAFDRNYPGAMLTVWLSNGNRLVWRKVGYDYGSFAPFPRLDRWVHRVKLPAGVSVVSAVLWAAPMGPWAVAPSCSAASAKVVFPAGGTVPAAQLSFCANYAASLVTAAGR